MAGGKETPRQKLIGIMYLVLLALLALQVGAEIMVKFQQLNDSLELLVGESQMKSSQILSNIEKKVQERGNKESEVTALKQAQELHSQTSGMIGRIQKYKEDLIMATGGYKLTEDLKDTLGYMGLKDGDNTSAMLVGIGDSHKLPGKLGDVTLEASKDGKGYAWSLQGDLNDFVKVLNKTYVDVDKATGGDGKDTNHWDPLALDGKDDPLFKKTEETKNKKWPILNFDHTPMIAALAFLTEKQAKLAQYEGEILAKLKGVVGAADFKFDKLGVMANADANTVVAGTKYRAQIFLTAFSDKIQPVISVGSQKLKVVNGKGEYTRTASTSGKPDKDGLYTNSYKAIIEVPDPLNPSVMKKFEEVVKFKVAKPVIKVESDVAVSLYANCGNALNITVPALGALYKPTFTVKGGSAVASITGTNGKGKLVIIPKKPGKISVTVISSGKTIGVQTFAVKSVPKPKFKIRKGSNKGSLVNEKSGEKVSKVGVLFCEAFIDDESFKKNLPRDKNFKVVNWKVELLKGSRPYGSKTFSNPSGNVRSLLSKVTSDGFRFFISIKKVKRRNYQGKMIDEKIAVETKQLSLNK
jgi:gliding motility-associated protein GldM